MKIKSALSLIALTALLTSNAIAGNENEDKNINDTPEDLGLVLQPLTVDQGPGGSCEYKEKTINYDCEWQWHGGYQCKTKKIYVCE